MHRTPRSSRRGVVLLAAACFLTAIVAAETPTRLPPVNDGPTVAASGVEPVAWQVEEPLPSPREPAPDWLTGRRPESVSDVEDLVPSIEERLAELETKYADLESAHGELEEAHDALEGNLDDYARTGHGGSKMKLNGRIHLDLWNFPGDSPGVNAFESGDPAVSPQDRLGFRRVRLHAAGELSREMLYKVEFELAGGNDIEFRDVYLGWEDLPLLRKLLFGNQKRPYGLDHLNSSRYNVFIERPFVVEGFNQDARRLGVLSYGVSDNKAWNWRYGVFNQRLVQDEGVYTSDHFQAQAAGRLANTLWYDEPCGGRNYVHWAVSGTFADTDPNANADNFAGSGVNETQFRTRPEARTDSRWLDTGTIDGGNNYGLLGLEGVVNLGPVQVVGEHQNVWLNRAGGDLHFHGGYVYISYFLTGEHVPWNRETGVIGRVVPHRDFYLARRRCGGGQCCGLGAWQVALRWSYADFSDRDIQGGVGESLTAGLNWHWTPYAQMQFNYIYGEITNNDLNAAGGSPNAGDYHILGTRLLVDF